MSQLNGERTPPWRGEVALSIALALLIAGCAKQPVNPSFAVSPRDAKDAIKAMAKDEKPLERPVVVLGGYQDIGIGPASFLPKFREAVGGGDDAPIVSVTYFFSGSFDDCRREVIKEVEKKFRSGDGADETVEVDVIGLSMGGIVARHAALARPGEKRLRIKRLFTISSPHRGAVRAALPTVHQLHRDLRSGSKFLRELEAAEEGEGGRDYEIIPYVRLGDWIVGPENAAPRDAAAAYWVPNPPLNSAHWGAPLDPRIVADIARRLRGETPFTTTQPTALPAS
jgi:hypothetical protein